MTTRIGTAERDGTFHSQGRALKMIFDQHPALQPVSILESSSASIENANRLHVGEVEFGFMASNWIGRAKNGKPPFPQPIDIRMAAPMNAGPLFFIVRADSPIKSVADLRGRRVAVGMKTSGMVQHAHNIFPVLGLSFSDFTPVYHDFAAGADALAAGEVDAQFQCPIPNKVMTELSERVAVRVLPYAPEDLAALMKAVSFYRSVTMRKGAFRGVDSDITQPAVVNVLATHARMPQAVVHEAVAAILANTQELGRLNSLFSGLNELFEPLRREGPSALEFGGVKLHPGALSAYRSAGLL
jgi:TRAP transporter TAXI family solute receptor